eukprot:CAMPEP_0181499034 /NCGR_PEP_ID=MMETSP1110-20121109/54428_1 /TAXON_ID=174948 /ORGANISM="Symbiodinium sp., Strain CCMP421" /LENGTH=129 /DNA_ID=CAMNT_0023627163 /DNA_START=430 /DNA_END=819 /DNA_ORIENTATION=+
MTTDDARSPGFERGTGKRDLASYVFQAGNLRRQMLWAAFCDEEHFVHGPPKHWLAFGRLRRWLPVQLAEPLCDGLKQPLVPGVHVCLLKGPPGEVVHDHARRAAGMDLRTHTALPCEDVDGAHRMPLDP